MTDHRVEEGSPLPYLARMAAAPLKISEAGTVQFPMVRHAAEIGWTTLTPDEARARRGGDAGTFLRDVLEELFQSLLHKLMTGEIRVADLDLSALSTKPTLEGVTT